MVKRDVLRDTLLPLDELFMPQEINNAEGRTRFLHVGHTFPALTVYELSALVR